MRMRKKPTLVPRMEACSQWWVRQPEAMPGRWRTLAPGCAGLWLEVGCGKGRFTAETAAANPQTLFIALERVPDAMVGAMEKARDMGLTNVFFVDADAARLEDYFAPGELDGMYINFCDPWPRKKNAKRRLTHRGFLEKYSRVVAPGGQIYFKTDNEGLFDFSLEEFTAMGFPLEQVTRNLHAGGPVGVMTDYEEKFYQAGQPIYRCQVTLHPLAPGTSGYDPARTGEH